MNNDSSHIRLSKEDRKNLATVKAQMVKIGLPESSISVSDVMRFALNRQAVGAK